ncbi:MAG: HAD hydrolase family protein [Bdellovibrionales bacterium]|nr:HAD hydrolase family protein [Bdellovibrionales bacterium]
MELSQELIAKLKKVKMLVTDVDGVMTDGTIFLGDDGEWRRHYSVRDGAGIVFLREAGYKVGIITGASSPDVRKRAEHLKIDYLFQGKMDKGPAFDEIKKMSGYTNEEISYIGDDVFDLVILEQVGFAATVPGAIEGVQPKCHYVTKRPEGDGALRELCEMIIKYGYYSK